MGKAYQTSYTIERKFLAKISFTEFVSRIIQSDIMSESKPEGAAE